MVANKLMPGDTVLPVAHHRSEADVVEEVCGRTDPTHQKSVIDDHVHHRQLTFFTLFTLFTLSYTFLHFFYTFLHFFTLFTLLYTFLHFLHFLHFSHFSHF